MKITSPTAAFMTCLFALTLTSGCAGLKRAYPDKEKFAFETHRNAEKVTTFTNHVLAVRTFSPAPIHKGSEFVYRKGNNEYISDYYRLFFSSPEALIAAQTAQWISSSGLFGDVVPLSSRIAPDLVLEGSLTALYGDLSDRIHPRAVLGLDLLLVDEARGMSRIVFHKSFRQDIPLKDATPTCLMDGWNQALTLILSDLEQHLLQLSL